MTRRTCVLRVTSDDRLEAGTTGWPVPYRFVTFCHHLLLFLRACWGHSLSDTMNCSLSNNAGTANSSTTSGWQCWCHCLRPLRALCGQIISHLKQITFLWFSMIFFILGSAATRFHVSWVKHRYLYKLSSRDTSTDDWNSRRSERSSPSSIWVLIGRMVRRRR